MGDLLKDLARTKPLTPEVDHDRMERDLAQITAMPRPAVWSGQAAWRRLAPVAVAFGVVAVLVIALLPSDRPEPAGPLSEWWHVRAHVSSLTVVGDSANPYVMETRADSDRWLTPERELVFFQQNGSVGPRTPADGEKWEAAGWPLKLPIVGSNDRALRPGRFRPAARETFDGKYSNQVSFAEWAAVPTDTSELKKVLEAFARDSSDLGTLNHRIGRLAMEITASPLRPEQRQAALAVLRTLPGVRDNGVGLALPSPPSSQYAGLETQLVVDIQTGKAVTIRTVITSAQHGLPAGTAVETQDFQFIGLSGPPPRLPDDVPINGEVDSPFIMNK
ncbi:hypothetical protein ACIA8G_22675 [Lentzea sp. NPDC051213]|uniref:hypothetical protein n=1 Tax=Lentzea sp. NPDC051213 TaxID=3364126 RepID=UPI00378B64FE